MLPTINDSQSKPVSLGSLKKTVTGDDFFLNPTLGTSISRTSKIKAQGRLKVLGFAQSMAAGLVAKFNYKLKHLKNLEQKI